MLKSEKYNKEDNNRLRLVKKSNNSAYSHLKYSTILNNCSFGNKEIIYHKRVFIISALW